MSQTETLLLVVLGFALAALIALFAGRLVWVTALRLGARRMQRQVPSTVVDLQTERDRLRAEYAMLSQRLGDRLETVKLRMVEHIAEVNRHRNRLELAEAELDAKSGEIRALEEKIAEAGTIMAAQAQTITTLEGTLAVRDNELATLRAMRSLPASPVPPPPTASGDNIVPPSLGERIARLNRLAQHVAAERSERGDAPAPVSAPADPLPALAAEAISQETLDIQKELERLDAEWSKRLEELPKPEGAEQAARPRAVANVISLANRIRALQKDLGNQ